MEIKCARCFLGESEPTPHEIGGTDAKDDHFKHINQLNLAKMSGDIDRVR